MAEILLSLTIIGVVAAITLPSLTGNINERTWNTQRKALYARFSQAIALMPALNGYGTFSAGDESTSAVDTVAETFVTDGLAKVLKINNICDNEHLADCGITGSYTNFAGSAKAFPSKLSDLNSMFTAEYIWYKSDGTSQHFANPQKDVDTKAAAFETQNGESIAVFYNPYCVTDSGVIEKYYSQPLMCANFIYDLNGTKGPNTLGKDIGFITAMYPTDPVVVAPMPLSANLSELKKQTEAGRACTEKDADSRLPNKAELSSIYYNADVIGMQTNIGYWSSSLIDVTRAWALSFNAGDYCVSEKETPLGIRCIKR